MDGDRDPQVIDLPDLAREVESGFTVGPMTATYRSVTGEPYVALYSGGILPEGARVRVYPTKEEAITAFRASFEAYAEKTTGSHLYWRTRPHLMCIEDAPRAGFTVRARLLISSAVATRSSIPRLRSVRFKDGASVTVLHNDAGGYDALQRYLLRDARTIAGFYSGQQDLPLAGYAIVAWDSEGAHTVAQRYDRASPIRDTLAVSFVHDILMCDLAQRKTIEALANGG